MPHAGRKQRREKRTREIRTLYYNSAHEQCRELKCSGVTRNISESGFSMYAVEEFREGTTLEVSFHKDESPRKATVRWCSKKVEGSLYVLGLAFN